MKFFLLINVEMPTFWHLWDFSIFCTYEHLKFHAQLSGVWKNFYNLGALVQSRQEHQSTNPQNPVWKVPSTSVEFVPCLHNFRKKHLTRVYQCNPYSRKCAPYICAVQMNGSTGEWFRLIVGFKQEYLLSSTLFNIFSRQNSVILWKTMKKRLAQAAKLLPKCSLPMTKML